MCDCRSRIESGVLESYSERLTAAGATGIEVSLQNYAMVFKGPVPFKQYAVAEISYTRHTKGTAAKPSRPMAKKETINVLASYCMFCGEKYATEEDQKAKAAEVSARED